MNIFKRIMTSAFIGIGLGTLINYIFVLIIGRGFSPAVPSFLAQFSSETTGIGTQLFIFALLGIIQGNASIIFSYLDHRKSSLLAISCLHYCIIVLPLLLSAWYLRWFQASFQSFLGMLVLISLIYGVIYLVNYLTIKRDILSINNKLR